MNNITIARLLFYFLLMLLAVPMAQARLYTLQKNNDLIGRIQIIQARRGQTFASIARRYDIGYYELIEANPGVDPEHIKAGTMLLIPTRYLLPPIHHTRQNYRGIVINIAEMRLYYFTPYTNTIYTYPIGIGRQNWETPIGSMSIVEKRKNPWWYVPKTIRESRKKDGVMLPFKMPPGPDNPLGHYAMRLSQRAFLIHGTNQPPGVGRRSTSGCIRLYPEDIKQLYTMTTLDTPVEIVNQPNKIGWANHQLYLESHEPLQEMLVEADKVVLNRRAMTSYLKTSIGLEHTKVDWEKAKHMSQQPIGIPLRVGQEKNTSHAAHS